MSARTLSSQLPELAGKTITLQGWVHRIRNFGGLRFLILRDRTGLAQIVIPKSLDLKSDLGEINCEWVVAIRGTVQAEPRAPGGCEVIAQSVRAISRAQIPPIEIFKQQHAEQSQLQTLLDHRAISLRVPEIIDVFRVQAQIVRAFRTHLFAQNFTEIFTPKLVLAGAEGGSAVFEVGYYERKAYLAQSPQFYKQMMVGSGLERVFEVGHAYRAEKSETSRHLTEFVSLDFEMGFIESEQDVMAMLARTIGAIFESLRQSCAPILARRRIQLPNIETIPQISYPDAAELLASRFGKTSGIEGDLDTEAEKLIGQWALDELGSPLIFVTGYSVDRRPAYAMPMLGTTNPTLTHSFDLLYHGVEIVTGGQRIHDHAQLVASFESRSINARSVEGYLEAFRHGMPPHGGMGMGLERLTKQLLGLDNVKEACLFPRDRTRLLP
ncbi:aspartate--tRNA(Asn) ligase [soil metagenome]